MDAVVMAKNLEERFLSADDKTGIPNVDNKDAGFADLPEDEFSEVELLIATVRDLCRRGSDCAELVLKRGHEDKLKEMYGPDSVGILAEAAAQMKDIAEILELLTGQELEPVPAVEPEPVEPDAAKEPKAEPKPEPKPEASSEEPPKEA